MEQSLLGRRQCCAGGSSATPAAPLSSPRTPPAGSPLNVGDTVPMGAGAFATVSEVKPYRHLVAQETFVLRPLPGNKTRLITRYRGMGFLSPAALASLALGACRNAVGPASPGRTSAATQASCGVAALVAAGLGNRAIAERLFLSPRTVEKHVEHVMDKLALGSRAEIAAWYARRASTNGSGR
jgi:DNA-binding CsgD family transcriptional regulator